MTAIWSGQNCLQCLFDFISGNCHAYFRCFQRTPDGPLLPCIYWCEPCSLVFDPNSKNCVYELEAPSGTCFDTPYPEISTTATTIKTTTTTATTTTNPTTNTPTTPLLPVTCSFHGQRLPFPGNCHLYYECFFCGDYWNTMVNNCGDWVFDPTFDTCRWPLAGDELCTP